MSFLCLGLVQRLSFFSPTATTTTATTTKTTATTTATTTTATTTTATTAVGHVEECGCHAGGKAELVVEILGPRREGRAGQEDLRGKRHPFQLLHLAWKAWACSVAAVVAVVVVAVVVVAVVVAVVFVVG